uniref:Gonadotropin subunit beta-2 n=1 Tax=Salarias fasciatus TaxID=181472 RepID=A0A672JJR0_SALFA
METAAFPFWLLFLLFGRAAPAAPACSPSKFTLYVEKPECDICLEIKTTICSGNCTSWVLFLKSLDVNRQSSCTYDRIEYRTVPLPGCPVDFTFPVALSCRCDSCDRSTTECTERAGKATAECTKPVVKVHAYPGQKSYLMFS